jgi:hypothetical protein
VIPAAEDAEAAQFLSGLGLVMITVVVCLLVVHADCLFNSYFLLFIIYALLVIIH